MWLLIIALYAAPQMQLIGKAHELSMTKLVDHHFESEAECLVHGLDIKSKLNEGMLAPVRFHCISILVVFQQCAEVTSGRAG